MNSKSKKNQLFNQTDLSKLPPLCQNLFQPRYLDEKIHKRTLIKFKVNKIQNFQRIKEGFYKKVVLF